MRSQHILQILRHLNMWFLKYELWKRTVHNEETSTLKCSLPLDKWSHYHAVFVMMKNKQKLDFSDYYNNIKHFQNIKCLIYHLKLVLYTY